MNNYHELCDGEETDITLGKKMLIEIVQKLETAKTRVT